MVTIQIAEEVYHKLYSIFNEIQVNVFLCGASDSAQNSIRERVAKKIKNNAKINIVYPEWLFANLMLSGENDLLSLENDLAKNVDIVVLPLEGIGAFCELGAFASFEDLIQRLLVINSSEFKRKHSFINDGPIRLIRKRAKNNILYYDPKDKDEVVDEICNRLIYFNKEKVSKEVTNLFNLSRFLGFLITILQPVSRREMESTVLQWQPSIPTKYFDPAIEILVEKGHISSKNSEGAEEVFRLTQQGFDFYIKSVGTSAGIIKVISRMRSLELWRKNRNKRRINLGEERTRLLE